MASLLLLKSMLVANALSKSKKKVKKPVVKTKPMKKLRKGSLKSKCRICDEEDGEIPIFNNFVHPNLSDDIHHFSGVKMENVEGRSKYMCQNCLDLLNGCNMFREMCQKSNKKMLIVTIKKETNVDLADNIENNIPDPDPDENEKLLESDSSFNIPSPNFSEEGMELQDIFNSKEFPETRTKTTKIPPNPTEDKLEKPEKYFLCDVCGKTAKSNANLLMHKSIHEEKFPFKCDKCPYRGRSYGLLKVHKASHLSESELPYRCTQCPKATTTSSNLAKHIRNVHSRDNKNRFKCTYCERAFSFQHDMKRHIKEIHLRQGTVECNVCFKKFNTRKILRGHQYKIHKMKGARQGRLPAYLQAQMGAPRIQPCDDSVDNQPDYIK